MSIGMNKPNCRSCISSMISLRMRELAHKAWCQLILDMEVEDTPRDVFACPSARPRCVFKLHTAALHHRARLGNGYKLVNRLSKRRK
jgi:hypothetical protein